MNTAVNPISQEHPHNMKEQTMTTTAARTSAVKYPHKDPSLADWTWATLYKAIAIVVIATAIGSVVEAIMAKAVMETFLGGEGDPLALLAAFCLVLMANLMSFNAGAAWHKSRAWSIGLMAAWAGLGLAMVLIRFKHADFAVPDLPPNPSRPDIDAAYAEARAEDYVSALFLAFMFAATGLFGAYKARQVGNPSLLRMLKAKSETDKRIPKWANIQGQTALALSRLGLRLTRIDASDQHYRGHLDEIAAVEAAGKEQSKSTQAEVLAHHHRTPEMTLMTLQPPAQRRKSTNDAPQDFAATEATGTKQTP
jgi:hypothetical protein